MVTLRRDLSAPSAQARTLKVLIVTPFPGKRNPYLALLTESLTEAGVDPHLASKWGLLPLWAAVREFGRPDLIHLQWQDHYFGRGIFPVAVVRTVLFFLQWLVLHLMGVRFVWTVHNILNHERRHPRSEILACRIFARLVDGIVVHCETAAAEVGGAYRIPRCRISVVPHGHYATWYPPAYEKAEARNRLGLAHDTCLFLFFGQVRAYKGLEELLDTFRRIKAEKCQLLLAGEARSPSLKRSLLSRATRDPRVLTRFEYIPDDSLITYLSASDLVVLPYRDALTSGAAILAASYSRPVLAPRQGCMQEFPPDSAILYDPEHPQGLAESLAAAISAPLELMGRAAREYAAQYPWSMVARQTLSVYRAIMRDGERGD